MRIFFFLVTLIVAIYFLLEIAKIFIYDLHRLTDYGWGYLTGRIVIFILFSILAIILIRKKKTKQDPPERS